MTHATKLAREDALTEALRAADEAIGQEEPTDQALRIIAAIKRLRLDEAVRLPAAGRVDYMARVQQAARSAWRSSHGQDDLGPAHDAVAGVDTPIGRLRLVTWRRAYSGERKGERIAWAGEYYLNDEPITVAEIRKAGLAQRPTTRQRTSRKSG